MSYDTKRSKEREDRVHKMTGYKRGGAVKDDEGNNNIHITINAKPTPDPSAGLGALAGMGGGPPPPPPPAMPPPPMPGNPVTGMPGGMGAGPGPIAMRRGGRVKKNAESSARSKTDGDKFIPDKRVESNPPKKADGGGVRQLSTKDGGSESGPGRLAKARNQRMGA